MLRPAIVLAGLLAFAVGAPAQTGAEASEKPANQVKYEEKLAQEFVARADWVQSLEEARRQAAEGKKLVFGFFSRSYAP